MARSLEEGRLAAADCGQGSFAEWCVLGLAPAAWLVEGGGTLLHQVALNHTDAESHRCCVSGMLSLLRFNRMLQDRASA